MLFRHRRELFGFVGVISISLGCSSSSEPSAPSGSSGSAGTTASSGGAGGSSTTTGGAACAAGSSGSNTAGSQNTGGTAGSGGGSSGGAAGSGGSVGGGGTAGGSSNDFCAQRAGLAFCEDFEKLAVGAATSTGPWAPAVNGDGTVEIDSSVAHSGKNSLKVHASGFSQFLVLSTAALVPSGPLHVRAYLRLNEAMTGGHNTFLVADKAASPGTDNAFRFGEMNAMLMYTVSGDTHGALANENFYNDHLPGAALMPMTWGCVEIVLDSAKPEIAISLDGVAIEDLHHTDWPLDAYDALRFGFEKYAGPVGDIWYDDIAVGTSPIGCQ
jgi:hypothetical protein